MKVESMQRPQEPKFEMDEFWEDLEDENGNSWIAKIILESYFYEGSYHLVKLHVSTSYPFTDEIQESVVNIIELRYGARVTLDCELELYLAMENWCKIKDYPYEISDLGRLRNIVKNNIINPVIQNGYECYTLYNESDIILRSTGHRLVGIYFIPNPENKPCVCHKDDNKRNNKKLNLFWGTHKENSEDMVNKGRVAHGERAAMSKLKFDDVTKIKRLKRLGATNDFIARKYGVCVSTIKYIINGKIWKYHESII